MLDNPRFRTLADSDRFVLGSIYEDAHLISRDESVVIEAGSHHSNPTAGLIAPDESWCVTAGEGLVLTHREAPHLGQREFMRGTSEDTRYVHAIRLDEHGRIEVLLDPWAEYAAVWRLDPGSGDLAKLRDGPHLRNEPYRDEVAY